MKSPYLCRFLSSSSESRTSITTISVATILAIGAAISLVSLPAAAADDEWSISETGINLNLPREVVDPDHDPQVAQFAIKKTGTGKNAKPVLPKVLPFSYVRGAELEIPYFHNRDLNNDLHDDTLLAAPTIFGSITYHPINWLELKAEATLEKLISVREEETTVLPNGDLQQREAKPWSLLFDQLYAKFKIPGAPLEFTIGRRGFLDPRLWVYDGESDGIILTYRPTDWTFEASVTRIDGVDLNVTTHVPRQFTNDYVFMAQYRGVADHDLRAFFVMRDNPPSADEGKPQHYILQATGRPSNPFNYWANLGYVAGRDENGLHLSAFGVDVGATYRFLNTWLQPSVTVHLAYGSGDGDPNDNENNNYRQTGLGSNEGRYGGVTQFKYYGEALNPELSNMQVVSVGGSIRPTSGIFLDLIYRHYRLNEIDTQIRGMEFEARMNENSYGQSKSVGYAIDFAVAFRRIFGINRLGSEIRAGVFFPGDAWDSAARSDKAISILGVIFI